MITKVVNLATLDELTYSLLPERAVVVAYMVQTKRNHNWWTYDWTLAKVSKSGKTVCCGDFAAIVMGGCNKLLKHLGKGVKNELSTKK